MYLVCHEFTDATSSSRHQTSRLESMLVEMKTILVDQVEHRKRPDLYHVQHAQESHSIARPTQQHHSERAYQDEVDDGSLLHLQRTLQREHPDKTVFTAVICPEV